MVVLMSSLLYSLLILPVPDLLKTSNYYSEILGFRSAKYIESKEPHICLYKDFIEIVLIESKLRKIVPNRVMHGYGYDGYFTTDDVEVLYDEVIANGANIVNPLSKTDYGNLEFVLEDIDSRWIGVGKKLLF